MNGRVSHKQRSRSEARQHFRRNGISVSQWARDHDFNPKLVFEVLAGRVVGRYGKSHRIAVLLGMKNGHLSEERCR